MQHFIRRELNVAQIVARDVAGRLPMWSVIMRIIDALTQTLERSMKKLTTRQDTWTRQMNACLIRLMQCETDKETEKFTKQLYKNWGNDTAEKLIMLASIGGQA